jgi:hypothetical protein
VKKCRRKIRLKVEIHTRERTAYDDPVSMPYAVKNPWFTGSADIATFSNEEILATFDLELNLRVPDAFYLNHLIALVDHLPAWLQHNLEREAFIDRCAPLSLDRI